MRADPRLLAGRRDDSGAAVVEFVLVSVLLVLLLFAVLQVAVYVYVRTVVAASAADGARLAASAGTLPDAGALRAMTLIDSALGATAARRVTCAAGPFVDAASGLASVVVRCRGRVAPVLLPIGLTWGVDVRGMALQERAP